jgi:Tol biopolymer transport system component
MSNKLKHFAIIFFFSFALLGCSQNTPTIPTPTSTSISIATPMSTFTPRATPTFIPTQIPKLFVDIRETLAPDIYIVYWSQNTWYIKGLNGHENKQLMPNISSEINTILELSPDGNQVAFSSTAGELSTYDLRSGILKSYTNPKVNGIYTIAWLSNGNTILYSGNLRDTELPDEPVGIYGVSLETDTTFTILNPGDERFKYGIRDLKLSKDTQWLAFYAPRLSTIFAPNPEYSIYTMDLDCLETPETCNETIQRIGDGTSPAWSSDGILGWDCSSDNKSKLCYINIDGLREPQTLFDISKITSSPKISFADFSWSPDGKYIAVNLVKPRENNIANDVIIYVTIISSDGKHVIEVTSLSDSESYWEGWSPDSRYLAYSNFLGYTEPYGEVGVRSPITYIYLYDIQSKTRIDLVDISSDREVFNFFITIK